MFLKTMEFWNKGMVRADPPPVMVKVEIEDVHVNANLRWPCEEEKNTYK